MSFGKILVAVVFAGALSLSATAAPVLYEYGVNIDGTSDFGDAGLDNLGVDRSLFDSSTGLGSVSVSIAGAGDHYVSMYVDHEVDQDTNTFFDESGSANGVAAANQNWEIDEPGFGSSQLGTAGLPYFGDIFANFVDSYSFAQTSFLDNDVFYDFFDGQYIGQAIDDVAMALDWSFLLGVDEIATIVFTVSEEDNGGGFYLSQMDEGSGAELYFFSSLSIAPVSVPEPGTLSLLLVALGGLALRRKVAA